MKTLFGTIPSRSACVANNNGYGSHETDADLTDPAMWTASHQAGVFCCKHCGAAFFLVNPKFRLASGASI